MKDTRILFVEDDPLSAESVRAWLEYKGASTTYATGPEAANDELSRAEFDVLLSDIQMPGNENLMWVESIARRFPALHIILLTGSPRIDSAIKATNLHVAAFLVKPPDFKELETIICALESTTRTRRRMRRCVEELRTALERDDDHAAAASIVHRISELNEMWPLIEADPYVRSIAVTGNLREALVDAIQVIEHTKDSFQSRELGKLRQRLQRVLAG